MTTMLYKLLAAVVVTLIVFGAGTASAGHRPNNEVLIGGAISQTGRYAEPAGRQVNAIKLWVDEVNGRGGLLGHKIALILLDDKSDTQTAIKLYEKLITEDKVDVLLAPYSSGITEAVANVNERYKMPFVAYGASSTPIWEKGRKYIFNIVAVAEDYQKGSVHLAKQIGVKRAAIIGEDSLFPRMSGKGARQWCQKLGIDVVVEENYPLKQTDFTALLQKIRGAGAEAIFSNSYFADAVAQLRQLRELDINLKLFSSTVGPGLPNFAEQLGSTAEYVLGFSQWEPLPKVLKHPGMQEFIDRYEKRFGEKPNYHAGGAYGALQVTESAIKKAGSFDNEKVRDALATIDVTNIYGRYKVDAKGLNDHEGLTFQILRGQRRIVWPDKWAEVKVELPMPEWSKR
jgi:branched-chain amino acid transport system substrate-binding protein